MSFYDYVSQVRTLLTHYGLSSGLRMAMEHAWRRLLRRTGQRINYGQRPLDADWDVLIVLDACRADLFQEFAPRHEISDQFDVVDTVHSCASSSPEWFEKGFREAADEAVADVAYVTQNAFFETVDHDRFHDTVPLDRSDTDRSSGLLAPSTVTDSALELYADSDANRFVIHYMPPHAPFQYTDADYDVENVPWIADTQSVWAGLQTRKFEFEEIWTDYGKNLLGVLDEVQRIVEHVTGKVVITADHANAMGEWGLYGHPEYVPAPVIKAVPWVEIQGNGKEFDESELTTPAIESDESIVENRLDALGYR